MIEDSIASGILLIEAEAEIDRLNKQLNKQLNTNMKQDTDCLIKEMRNTLAVGPIMQGLLMGAADRLEELQCELDRLSSVAIRPEPSRLEIAAMILAAMCDSQYTWSNAEGIALRKADTLIAAAKEGK